MVDLFLQEHLFISISYNQRNQIKEKIEIEIYDANAKHHVDWEPRTTICGMAPELNRTYDLLDSAGFHY